MIRIKDVQSKFRVFRAGQGRSPRRAIYFAMSVVGFMLLTTAGNADDSRGKESHEPWHKQATATHNKAIIVGKASWYGQSAAGRKTATGEGLDPNKLTAASTELPLQSLALVTDLKNGLSVCVRINDCGPCTQGRSSTYRSGQRKNLI
jgi:rare lipoprotein A (peptidoglycan hydrolase)